MISIEQLQPDLVFKLQSEAVFAPIVIFKEREERTSSQIDERLANVTGDSRQGQQKLPGASITVKMPSLGSFNPNAPGPLSEISVTIVVKENPKINIEAPGGTGISAEQWVQNVLQAIHGFFMEGTSEVLYAVSVAPNKEFEYLNLLAYNVVVRATYPMDFPARCPMPSENVVGQTVTLTPGVCPGVVPPASPVIYYTTDGSFPGSGNPTALIYTVPFTVPNPTIVRWSEYAANYQGSAVGRGTVPASSTLM